eukprot:3546853-Prymnesium_polylepis.2
MSVPTRHHCDHHTRGRGARFSHYFGVNVCRGVVATALPLAVGVHSRISPESYIHLTANYCVHSSCIMRGRRVLSWVLSPTPCRILAFCSTHGH